LKIVHLIHSVDNIATGPSNSVRGLCYSLANLNLDVNLATFQWESESVNDSFLLRFPLGKGPRKLGLSPEMWKWLVDQSGKSPKLIMHSHNLWMMTAFYPHLIRRNQSSTRFICSTRGTLSPYSLSTGSRFKPIYWSLIQKPALRGADCLHATSELECEDIRRLGFKIPVAIIPNGIAMPDIINRPLNDLRSFLYLGRLHPEKGLEGLLYSWAQVQAKLGDWCLRIVGPDPIGYRDVLEKLSHKLGLQRIFFSGTVSGQEKWQILNASEVLVLPSPSENFGMVVAEALAAEVPVIATSGTPWSELASRRAGWYCGTSSKDIAFALLNAAGTCLAERREMGKHGREWMSGSYGWESIGNKMAITYNWLFQGGPAPSWIDGAS